MLLRRSGIVIATLLCSLMAVAQAGPTASSSAAKPSAHARKPKPAVVVELPPPEPTPIPSMTPEEQPALAPRVTFHDGRLTVDATNATLAEVLHAIRTQTAITIEIPSETANDRVAVHLSGTLSEVIAELLDGSNFGYVIRSSADDPQRVQELLLSRKPSGKNEPQVAAAMNRPYMPRAYAPPVEPPPPPAPSADSSAEQPAAEQPAPAQPSSAQPSAADKPPAADNSSNQPAPPVDAPAAIDAHPAPPAQALASQLTPEQAAQQQTSNYQFLQNMFQARQKLQQQANQPQQPSQPQQ